MSFSRAIRLNFTDKFLLFNCQVFQKLHQQLSHLYDRVLRIRVSKRGDALKNWSV